MVLDSPRGVRTWGPPAVRRGALQRALPRARAAGREGGQLGPQPRSGCAGVEGATPTRYPSFHFSSALIFCTFFCLRISFSLRLGGGGCGWQGGGRWVSLPCPPVSGDVVMVVVYSGILQVNRLG